jgi:hypothetical protein
VQSAPHIVARTGGHNRDVSWLGFSIVASIVLTIVLNLALWMFPNLGERLHDALARLADAHERNDDGGEPQSRMRVYFPWKAMLIGSIVLTILINVLLTLLR